MAVCSHFTNHFRSLLIQLFLEAGEHLEKLTFGGELCLRLVSPYFMRVKWGRVLFVNVFNVSV